MTRYPPAATPALLVKFDGRLAAADTWRRHTLLRSRTATLGSGSCWISTSICTFSLG